MNTFSILTYVTYPIIIACSKTESTTGVHSIE